jgi:hypothetical protein
MEPGLSSLRRLSFVVMHPIGCNSASGDNSWWHDVSKYCRSTFLNSENDWLAEELFFFFNWCSRGWNQLGPVGTAATNMPIVPAPGDYDDGEIGGIMIGSGNRSTRRKPAPVPLCPPQNPHAVRTRTRAAAVGSQRLTAWATERPLAGEHKLYEPTPTLTVSPVLASWRVISWFTIQPWTHKHYVPPKRLWTSIGLQSIIYHHRFENLKEVKRCKNRWKGEVMRKAKNTVFGADKEHHYVSRFPCSSRSSFS